MMNMKQKIRIHDEIERADREHRLWFQNNRTLDQLTASFPIGSMVDNFGVPAIVDGYQARNRFYTGDLILRDAETGLRWIGNTDYCTAIA